MSKPRRMPDPKYTLRPTLQAQEMAFLVIVDNVIEWCADRATADRIANEALADAATNDYTCTVFVAKCLAQNGRTP